jgi:hypothetical protein
VRTQGLTLRTSACCLHVYVYMCFVQVSEQTAVIFLYSMNWLVIITERECVYCAVQTGSLNVIQDNLNILPRLRQLVAVLSPQRPGLDPSPMRVRFVVDKVALGLVFLPELLFSPDIFIPSMLLSHLLLHVPLTRNTNRAKPGNRQVLFGKYGNDG